MSVHVPTPEEERSIKEIAVAICDLLCASRASTGDAITGLAVITAQILADAGLPLAEHVDLLSVMYAAATEKLARKRLQS